MKVLHCAATVKRSSHRLKSDTAIIKVPEQEPVGLLPTHLLGQKTSRYFMSATGVAIAEGNPPIERTAGVRTGAGFGPDHPWDVLADHTGAVYESIELAPTEAESDRWEAPAAQTLGAPVAERTEVTETTAEISAKTGYRLGPIAFESAGVRRADQLPGEAETRARYQRFLGGVAMHASRANDPEAPQTVHRSSLDILRAAATGSKEAFDALLIDAKTHLGEIFGGIGEGMEVELPMNEHGEVVWNGQTTEARQFHVLAAYPNQDPKIREAVHAEGLSGFRLEDRRREGQLAGRTVIDVSVMPDASQADLSEWGYPLNTITVAIRDTRFTEDACRVGSVFVAGVDQRLLPPRKPNETEADEIARQKLALSLRFDIRVARRMRALLLGESAPTGAETPAEMLAAPLDAPDGFDKLDMVMLYDVLAAEEVAGDVKTFFGSVELWQQLGSPAELTRRHYEAHMQQREARQAKHGALCQAIVREQIRRQHTAHTPRQAVELKRRVMLDLAVEHAVRDTSVDGYCLGRVSGALIDAARESYARGDDSGGNKLTNKAKEEAKDSSCPPGERNKNSDLETDDTKEKDDCNEVKDGQEVECPYCGQTVRADVPEPGGRIYCSNKTCDAARDKQTPKEEAKEAGPSSKPSFLAQFSIGAKQAAVAKNSPKPAPAAAPAQKPTNARKP